MCAKGKKENGRQIRCRGCHHDEKAASCGSKDWEILRVGADFRLKCKGCGHQIMVPRRLVEKYQKYRKKLETPAPLWYHE